MQVTTSLEAPTKHDGGHWPARRTSVLDWLMLETSTERYIDDILVEMCRRLRETGVPVARSTMSFRIEHPQFQGASMLWEKGMSTAQVQTFEHGALDSEAYVNSPIRAIHSGIAAIRQRIDHDTGSEVSYPIFAELREKGLTEYLAWPLEHTFGRRHVVTFATDRQGGFEDAHVALIADLLPALSLVSEIRLKNRFVRTILETYVGPHASAEILAGAITRGSGKTVSAAILVCDLRDFSTISEMWPRDDVIEILNGYFDAMSEPVEAHGGEILKFMGDELLAIFPLERSTALAHGVGRELHSRAAFLYRHPSGPGDDLGGAYVLADDPRYSALRLVHIGLVAIEPAPGGVAVRDDRGQRLVHLVGDRRHQFAEGRDECVAGEFDLNLRKLDRGGKRLLRSRHGGHGGQACVASCQRAFPESPVCDFDEVDNSLASEADLFAYGVPSESIREVAAFTCDLHERPTVSGRRLRPSSKDGSRSPEGAWRASTQSVRRRYHSSQRRSASHQCGEDRQVQSPSSPPCSGPRQRTVVSVNVVKIGCN